MSLVFKVLYKQFEEKQSVRDGEWEDEPKN